MNNFNKFTQWKLMLINTSDQYEVNLSKIKEVLSLNLIENHLKFSIRQLNTAFSFHSCLFSSSYKNVLFGIRNNLK